MKFTKGHGTRNDFLILEDLEGSVTLNPETVRALCERRAGIGADGVLRIVRSENHPEAESMAAEAPWFMDYRNADGSLAEMCGNGLRVFVRYLQTRSLVEQDAAVATRGGIRCVHSRADGLLTVDMGRPRILADRPIATAAPDFTGAGTAVQIPNPHVVVPVADDATLDALELHRAPVVTPALPDGQNVEFVLRTGTRQLRMRVHERGSGETFSCGTGICAAVVAIAEADGTPRDGQPWQVDVPGGTCHVTWQGDDSVLLTGPAVLVGEVEVDDAWLQIT